MKYSIKKNQQFFIIDVQEDRMVICAVSRQVQRLKVTAVDAIDLPSSGAEDSVQSVIDFIKDFQAKAGSGYLTAVLNLCSPSDVRIHTLKLPPLPDKEIVGAARWQLKDEVPFPLESAVIGWQKVGEVTDEEGSIKLLITFIAAREEAVTKWLALLTRCQIEILRIGNRHFNVGLHLSSTECPDSYGVIHMTDGDSSLAVYENGKLAMLRSLPFSIDQVLQSMTGVLITDVGKVGLTLEQARQILNTHGIPQSDNDVLHGSIKGNHVISLIRPRLEALIRELNFSLNYYQSFNGKEIPSKIYVLGTGAEIKHLKKYLQKESNYEFESLPAGPAYDIVVVGENQGLMNAGGYLYVMLASGLGVADHVDLLPQEYRQKKSVIIKGAAVRAIMITLAAVFFILAGFNELRIKDYTERIQSAHQHLSALKVLDETSIKMREKEQLLTVLREKEIFADHILKVVSNAVPDAVILSEILYDRPQASLVIKGRVPLNKSNGALTAFMERLEASELIDDASLISSRTESLVEEFVIQTDLNQEGF